MKTKVYKSSIVLICFLMVSLIGNPAMGQTEKVPVGEFTKGDLSGWENKSFEGKTQYQLINDQNRKVLQAVSQGSASGYFKEVNIDLKKTPYLNWSWKIENILDGNNEKIKSGDDYPARVYVVIKTGPFFFSLKSLNYVWSSNNPIGSNWENAVTSRAHVISVQSGSEKIGLWISEKRNIVEDFKEFFGDSIDSVDGVAIMTDTDNTGQNATAYYGDIFFTSN